MKQKELKKYLIDFIESHNMLVLSTCSKNEPRATPMDYYSDKLTIYVYPGSGKKIKNPKLIQ